VDFPWTILRSNANQLFILCDSRISTRPRTLPPALIIRLTEFSAECTGAATATVLYISLLRKEMLLVAAGEIWARDLSKAKSLRMRLLAIVPGVKIRTVTDLKGAVQSADAVIPATVPREPIVRGEWLRAGQHITAVGADDPTKCELDAVVLNRARVFVDSLDISANNGDIAAPSRMAITR
jgi:ornithine cyclodeaminase/alanine dehydrogenase-like protein (mu-crystallin family)